MARAPALPFTLRRSDDVIGATAITSTKETVHGVLLLEVDRLVLQWRVERRTQHVGWQIREEAEVEPLREFVIPLHGLASASVRSAWWLLGRRARIVLTATDLRTFEGLVGQDGFETSHPSELTLKIRARDRLAAREFAADLELALAERALTGTGDPASGDPHRLEPPGPRRLPDGTGRGGAA